MRWKFYCFGKLNLKEMYITTDIWCWELALRKKSTINNDWTESNVDRSINAAQKCGVVKRRAQCVRASCYVYPDSTRRDFCASSKQLSATTKGSKMAYAISPWLVSHPRRPAFVQQSKVIKVCSFADSPIHLKQQFLLCLNEFNY